MSEISGKIEDKSTPSGVTSGLAGMKLACSRKYPPISGIKNTVSANKNRKTPIPTKSLTV